jgi:hypothetical protein
MTAMNTQTRTPFATLIEYFGTVVYWHYSLSLCFFFFFFFGGGHFLYDR